MFLESGDMSQLQQSEDKTPHYADHLFTPVSFGAMIKSHPISKHHSRRHSMMNHVKTDGHLNASKN